MIFDKYFAAVQVLDKFNWAPCMQDKAVAALVEKDGKWWNDFWTQKDPMDQMAANIKKNEKELRETVSQLQKNWHSNDYASAGKKYGQMWALLMGGKPAKNDDVVFGWSD